MSNNDFCSLSPLSIEKNGKTGHVNYLANFESDLGTVKIEQGSKKTGKWCNSDSYFEE